MITVRSLRIEAATRRDFNAAIADVTEAINASGGWILSHQLYSNKLAVINLEIRGDSLAGLTDGLRQAEIVVQPIDPVPPADREVMVQLAMTVLNDGPDQRRDVPAFG